MHVMFEKKGHVFDVKRNYQLLNLFGNVISILPALINRKTWISWMYHRQFTEVHY